MRDIENATLYKVLLLLVPLPPSRFDRPEGSWMNPYDNSTVFDAENTVGGLRSLNDGDE